MRVCVFALYSPCLLDDFDRCYRPRVDSLSWWVIFRTLLPHVATGCDPAQIYLTLTVYLICVVRVIFSLCTLLGCCLPLRALFCHALLFNLFFLTLLAACTCHVLCLFFFFFLEAMTNLSHIVHHMSFGDDPPRKVKVKVKNERRLLVLICFPHAMSSAWA